jgi:hypothetical protein
MNSIQFGRRKLTLVIFTILVSLIIFPSVFQSNPTIVEESPIHNHHSAAWLSGWEFRKSHQIVGSNGAGTNYQIRIHVEYGSGIDSGNTVYLDSHSRSDFGDVRFTDDDGTTELDYWIEEYTTGDDATFWVEVRGNLDLDQTIYIYYGNSGVSTTSNGETTFIFFEDWSSAPPHNIGSTGSSFDISSSTWLHASNYGLDGAGDGIEWNGVESDSSDYTFSPLTEGGRVRGRWDYDVDDTHDVMGYMEMKLSNGATEQTSVKVVDAHEDYIDGYFQYVDRIGETELHKTGNSYYDFLGTWEGCFYENSGTDWWFFLEDTLIDSGDRDMDWTWDRTSSKLMARDTHDLPARAHMDWQFVAKFVDLEPVHGDWGDEELVTGLTSTPETAGESGFSIPFPILLSIPAVTVVVIVVAIVYKEGLTKGSGDATSYISLPESGKKRRPEPPKDPAIRKRMILGALKSYPRIGISDISEMTGIDEKEVRETTLSLIGENRVSGTFDRSTDEFMSADATRVGREIQSQIEGPEGVPRCPYCGAPFERTLGVGETGECSSCGRRLLGQ